ncbi:MULTISPECIES: TlpA family protein disulfide reductase [Chitinophagaceae]
MKKIIVSKDNEIMILDFWATWCLPCIENLRYLDKIAKKYQDVRIVAISQEKREKIEKELKHISYLRNTPLLFCSDTTHVKFIKYKIVPTTVIIKNGKIKYMSEGQYLSVKKFDSLYSKTKGFIHEYVSDRTIDTTGPSIQKILAIEDSSYSLLVAKTPPSPPNYQIDSSIVSNKKVEYTRFAAENFTLLPLYRYAYNKISVNWIVNKTGKKYVSEYIPENLVSLTINGHFDKKEQLFSLAQRALNTAFPEIQASKSIENKLVYILNIDTSDIRFKNILSSDSTLASSLYFYGPNFSGKNIELSTLYGYLSNEIGYLKNGIVISEIPINKRINLKLEWSYADPSTLFAALKEHGISLKQEYRNVELIILH